MPFQLNEYLTFIAKPDGEFLVSVNDNEFMPQHYLDYVLDDAFLSRTDTAVVKDTSDDSIVATFQIRTNLVLPTFIETVRRAFDLDGNYKVFGDFDLIDDFGDFFPFPTYISPLSDTRARVFVFHAKELSDAANKQEINPYLRSIMYICQTVGIVTSNLESQIVKEPEASGDYYPPYPGVTSFSGVGYANIPTDSPYWTITVDQVS